MVDSKSNKQMSEQKVAASSYILQFYQDIQNLNHWLSIYHNLLTELKFKVPESEEISNVDEEEKKVLSDTAQNFRYYVNKCFLGYRVIVKATNATLDKDVQDSYDKLKDTFIMSESDADDFVIGVNMFLMNEVVKNLLETSQTFIDKVFGDKSEES